MDWLKEIKEKYISINGIKLHTVIIGSGEPLILLHGFPDFWYGWKSIIPKLKDDFELIIPDLRGFNLSDKPKGIRKYRIELLVDDIHTLSEKLNLGSFFLAGHDWGALISWAFAEKYPKKVKIGKDGLVIRDKFGSGLLLPQVAVEWGWDSKKFLDETCRKAGLSPTCWDNMKQNVYKFQADVFREEKGKVVAKKLY